MAETFVLNSNHSGRSTVLSNVLRFLGKLSDGKSWKVEISEYRKSRSNTQNHALFGVAYPAISQSTGHTKDELHLAFCKRYFGTVEVEIFGQVEVRPFRTTTTGPDGKRDVIDARAFAEFYNMVQDVGNEAGIYVPDPDPFHAEKALRAA